MSQDKRTARRKGMTAAGVAGTAAVLAMVNVPLIPILGFALAGYLTYDWFMFRAKRGMRF